MDKWFRVLAAVGLVGSAAVHFYLYWGSGYSDIDVVGPLFLVNGVAGVVIAVAVLFWKHWLPALGAFGFGAVTLVSYFLATTVGFFGVHDQFNSQFEYWGVVTEALCVVFGLVLLVRDLQSRRAVAVSR